MFGIHEDDAKRRMVKICYPFGEEEVFFFVDSYSLQGNLYVGLLCLEDGNVEPFADITANLPGEILGEGEAYLANDFADSHLQYILDNGIGKVVGHKQNGFVNFTRVAFDLDKLRELDPEGLGRYLHNRKQAKPM